LAALVCGRLGFWQVSRLQERRALNATARAARALPPVELDDPVQAARAAVTGLHHRRVRVTGRYDHAAEIVLRGQSEGGVPGVRLVTPLKPLGGDTVILVQRGYVTTADARTIDPGPLAEVGVRVVEGIAFRLPDSVAGEPREEDGRLTWRRVDLGALRERLPYPLANFLVLQLPDSSLPKLPRRDAAPALDDGPHLSYAVQWFSFAVTALVVGSLVGLKRRT
jgi:surfeit locus 1 family protein